jgi:large subunit ribosomal protein L3
MSLGLIGTKLGMTRILGDRGVAEPVTVVQAGPCVVLQVRQQGIDGYDALQLGFGDVKPHRSSKPMIGHAAKAGVGPKRVVREFRLDEPATMQLGDVLTVESFTEGEVAFVDVTATTKGKGFQGGMKRHGFGGLTASHGTERKHRSPGGIGGHANGGTGRGIKKGKKMAGHMGDVRCTTQSLRLLKVDAENGLLVIRGSIPGPNGGTVIVHPARKKGAKS